MSDEPKKPHIPQWLLGQSIGVPDSSQTFEGIQFGEPEEITLTLIEPEPKTFRDWMTRYHLVGREHTIPVIHCSVDKDGVLHEEGFSMMAQCMEEIVEPIPVKFNPDSIRVPAIEWYSCGKCDGDLHADWECPSCKTPNLCTFFDPTDGAKDSCERCKQNVLVFMPTDGEDETLLPTTNG